MQCVDRHQLLLRHLMIKLAPVLLGVKPAGMVRLTNCGRIGGGAQCDLFCLHQREILEALHLECRILRNDGIDLVVLFFRRAVLERTLASSEAAGFLKECGYPSGEGMAAILEELTARCRRGGNFPHEIGIFLGYPLKDVRGFIEDRSACRPVPRGGSGGVPGGDGEISLRRGGDNPAAPGKCRPCGADATDTQC